MNGIPRNGGLEATGGAIAATTLRVESGVFPQVIAGLSKRIATLG
jgi:hypothetical protein